MCIKKLVCVSPKSILLTSDFQVFLPLEGTLASQTFIKDLQEALLYLKEKTLLLSDDEKFKKNLEPRQDSAGSYFTPLVGNCYLLFYFEFPALIKQMLVLCL